MSVAINSLIDLTELPESIILTMVLQQAREKFKKLSDSQIEAMIEEIEKNINIAETSGIPVVIAAKIVDGEEMQDYGN